jgi:hypothetical protein
MMILSTIATSEFEIAGESPQFSLWKLRPDLMLVFKNKTAAIRILSSKIADIEAIK